VLSFIKIPKVKTNAFLKKLNEANGDIATAISG